MMVVMPGFELQYRRRTKKPTPLEPVFLLSVLQVFDS